MTMCFSVFFFNDTATTEIYTLSLHDALPILPIRCGRSAGHVKIPGLTGTCVGMLVLSRVVARSRRGRNLPDDQLTATRSEEHTSELQSRQYLVCRLLLEKKKHSIPFTPPYIP